MNVKLQIREVKEEERQLTIEERCMLSNSESGRGDLLTVMARDRLRELGFVGSYVSNRDVGVFRTETIRDATPKEIIAWHTLQSLYVCSHNMPIQLCGQCANNLGPDGCYIVRTRGRAEEILKGKEVILTLPEE